MKVHRIVDASFVIKTNIYLIESEKNILVDSGFLRAGKTISSIEEITGNISAVVLTHGHKDHIGGALKISKRFKCPVFIHEEDLRFLNFPAKEIGSKIYLNGGDFLEVIHTPGHTPGGICLFHKKTKSLFSGDTIFPNGKVGRFDLEGGSYNELLKSIEKLSKLDVKNLYPGHDHPVIGNARENIKKSLEFVKNLGGLNNEN